MSENSSSKQSNSLVWHVFFGITVMLLTFGILGIGFIENLTLLDYSDVLFSIISTVGLYGFTFYKPIGTSVFWRYFFYWLTIETLILLALLPLLGIPVYGEKIRFNSHLLINVLYMATTLYALYQYAYRRPFIWQDR